VHCAVLPDAVQVHITEVLELPAPPPLAPALPPAPALGALVPPLPAAVDTPHAWPQVPQLALLTRSTQFPLQHEGSVPAVQDLPHIPQLVALF
jgi:hypothetical protein